MGQARGQSGSRSSVPSRLMPRIGEFYGIVIYMYWRDHNPPHFHAIYSGDEALVVIADGKGFAGSLPRTALRLKHPLPSYRSWAFGSVVPVNRPARIVHVEYLGELTIGLSFDDGLRRELDLEPMLHGGALDELRDPERFAEVGLDDVAGTVCWPTGLDLDPDVLHGNHPPATGAGPRVISERRLRTTS